MADRRGLRARGAAAVAALAVLGSCAGGSGAGPEHLATDTGEQVDVPPATEQSEPVRIRFALAPDPVWSWLEDSGAVAAWEADRNIRIDSSTPFDQFAAFAGGHADVVIVNALDLPRFVLQPERDPLIIGKYTTDRSILAVKRSSRAESLDDLVDRRIAVESSLGSTLLWGIIADHLYGMDFRVGGADFDLVTVEAAGLADLVMRGGVDACICRPDVSVAHFASGRLRPLYGSRSAAEIYAGEVAGDAAGLPMAEVFVVNKDWYEQNRDAVDSFLSLWEDGIREWTARKGAIIADYPHLLSVQTGEEIAWMTGYASEHDWVVPSVHISLEEAATHAEVFGRMQRIGLLGAGTEEPDIDLSYALELAILESIMVPGSDSEILDEELREHLDHEDMEEHLDRLRTRLSTPERESGG